MPIRSTATPRRDLGRRLAEAGHGIVYGGGSRGSMGAVADGALEAGGTVVGILPQFMADLEWGHPGLTELQLVEDMRERKHRLLTDSDAVIALPGGCGTLEELFEAITLKRLGIYLNPIVLLDTAGFYQPLDAFMHQVIDARFMNPEHEQMWQRVDTPDRGAAGDPERAGLGRPCARLCRGARIGGLARAPGGACKHPARRHGPYQDPTRPRRAAMHRRRFLITAAGAAGALLLGGCGRSRAGEHARPPWSRDAGT